jgi:hypothetical protein
MNVSMLHMLGGTQQGLFESLFGEEDRVLFEDAVLKDKY